MFASTLIAGVSSLLLASASPIGKRAVTPFNVTDGLIFQYALTLEHLENTFYAGALAKFSAADFAKAGYPDWVRGRVAQIGAHEASHVALLSSVLGAGAPMPCTYNFPYTDVASFLGLAAVVENVGISAYLGAAADIMSKTYLTAAGAILSSENQHQAWLASAVEKANPWSSPYATPLRYNGVYSIVAPFFVSCPSTNPALPFTAFPALGAAVSGSTVTLTYSSNSTAPAYLIVYYGLMTTAVPVTNKMATLPAGLQGTAYAVVSTSSNTTVIDANAILAGPAIIVQPFVASATNPSPATAGQ